MSRVTVKNLSRSIWIRRRAWKNQVMTVARTSSKSAMTTKVCFRLAKSEAHSLPDNCEATMRKSSSATSSTGLPGADSRGTVRAQVK